MKRTLAHIVNDYGMLIVLLLLCALFSVATIKKVHPVGAEAGERMAKVILDALDQDVRVMIAARWNPEDVAFADALEKALQEAGISVVARINGRSPEIRAALDRVVKEQKRLDVVACTQQTVANCTFLDPLQKEFPGLSGTRVLTPASYYRSKFFDADNLLNNVAPNASIYAIIAIGMTMVIITGGIDLSVGSLMALSAVTAAMVMRDGFGGAAAGVPGMMVAIISAIGICALAGLFSGVMVTGFSIPPFVVTLAMMSVARGMAYILADNQAIDAVPSAFNQFSIGRPLGIANSVLIMLVLYVAAHIVMTRTVLGRYIYAVGGNREAARLSGVPVKRVLLFVYALCGGLAGLGGALEAAKLSSGSPLYGREYELYVIAAVVVGGTSIMGGEGKILNSLIGALMIAVIQTGMNQVGIDSNRQLVVMGTLILAAVLIDTAKKRGLLRLTMSRRS